MDPLDIAGHAEAVESAVEEVIDGLEPHTEGADTRALKFPRLLVGFRNLRSALELVSHTILDTESLSSEQLVTDYSEIWEILDAALSRYAAIISRFRKALRGWIPQTQSEPSSSNADANVLSNVDVKIATLQAEAHKLILQVAMSILTLAAASKFPRHSKQLMDKTTHDLRHQLVQIEKLRKTVQIDEECVEPELQLAILDTQALKSIAKRPRSADFGSDPSSSGSPSTASFATFPAHTSSANALNQFYQLQTQQQETRETNTSLSEPRDRRGSASTDESSVVNWTVWEQSKPTRINSTANKRPSSPGTPPKSANASWFRSALDESGDVPFETDATSRWPTRSEFPPMSTISTLDKPQSLERTSTSAFLRRPSVPREDVLQLQEHNYINAYLAEKLLALTVFPTTVRSLVIELTSALRWACRGDDPLAMNLLLGLGADPNAASDTNPDMSLLIETIFKRSPVVVETLLDGGANINAQVSRTPFGGSSSPLRRATIEGVVTPLSYAAVTGNVEVVDLLLARSAETDFPCGDKGLTPMFLAALIGRGDIVEKLLEADANSLIAHLKLDIEMNLAHIAAWYGQVSVLEVLQKARRTYLFERQSYINFENFWELSDKRDWKYDETPNKGTALHAAVLGRENVHTITFVLKNELVAINAVDDQGCTALHLCLAYFRQSSWTTLVKLLEYHADTNALDSQGRTPLHYLFQQSAESERDVVVLTRLASVLLSSQDLDLETEDNLGRTPMVLRRQKYPGSFTKTKLETVKRALSEDSKLRFNRKFTKELEGILKKRAVEDKLQQWSISEA